MSYEIYKSIKQNKDGSFDCVCACSNVFNARTGGRVFSDYHMTYFNDNFPTANKKELKAIWLLYSTWSGDKFYPTAWKEGQKLAGKFMKEFEVDYEIFYNNHSKWLEYAKEFVKYMDENKANYKKKKYIVQFSDGSYVSEKFCGRCYTTLIKENAKVFNANLATMEDKFKGYSVNHWFIEVK